MTPERIEAGDALVRELIVTPYRLGRSRIVSAPVESSDSLRGGAERGAVVQCPAILAALSVPLSEFGMS